MWVGVENYLGFGNKLAVENNRAPSAKYTSKLYAVLGTLMTFLLLLSAEAHQSLSNNWQ